MFAAIDAFVMWYLNQPLSQFMIGYFGVRVFMCIFDALLSPGCDDYAENEDTDDN